MRKLYFLFFLAFLPLVVSAQAVEIDGIYYNLNSSGDTKTAEVTENPNKYSEDIVIPETVTYNDVTYSVSSIGESAFYNCFGLISVAIPNSVKSIGNFAFSGCSNLTALTIPVSVTSINEQSFPYCGSLTSIIVEDGNTEYDSRDNCNAIIETSTNKLIVGCKNTQIPSSVTSIGILAFNGCKGLTTITIPKSVIKIEHAAFGNCSALASIVVESDNPVFDSRDNCNAIINKQTNELIAGCINTIIPNSVTYIGSSAFSGVKFETLVLPEGIKGIDRGAFYSSALTSITIPQSVVFIDENAFDCPSLSSIVVEDGNTVYDSRDNCNAIIETNTNTLIVGGKNTLIPNNVIHIGNFAFVHRFSLKKIIIPEGVKTVGNNSFVSCYDLEEVVLPSSLTTIGFGAFRQCTKMKTVISYITNPSGVLSSNDVFDSSSALLLVPVGTLAKYQAISGWTKFSNIEEGGLGIVDNLNYTYSFTSKTATLVQGDYENYSSITIPSKINIEGEDYNVVRIGSSAFKQCKNLKSISLPDGIKYIDDQAFYQTGITEINLPSSLESIGVSSFWNCNGLKTLTIPEGMKSIGSNAFRYCYYLQTLELPSGLGTISPYAFGSCTRLTNIVSHIQEPFNIPNNVFGISSWNNGVETITPSPATLYVPQSSIDAYKATEGWSSFKNVLPLEDILANIEFADAKVKEICVANWDTNGDGELSKLEASMVSDLGDVFRYKYELRSFHELKYFTGLISISGFAFSGINDFSVTIPENVKDISFFDWHPRTVEVVENNPYLKFVDGVLYNNDLTILYYCTEDGDKQEFEIPNSVKRISSGAFNGRKMTSVTIPQCVTDIWAEAFWGCSSLTTIFIPNSVTYIGTGVFGGCKNLTSIIVEEDNPVYDSRDNCNAIIKTSDNTLIQGCSATVIPYSVTAIGSDAFWGINSLNHIEIPPSVLSIGSWGFAGTGLTSVTIPQTVTSIGDGAFATNLKSVIVEHKEPLTIDAHAFSDFNKSAVLYVPAGSKAAYESAEVWKDFKEIIEMGETASITIGKSGKASYCGNQSLDFSFSDEVKAYIATGFDKDEGTIWLTRVKDVPAGVPVLIKGEADKTYDVPVTDSQNSYYTNMFVGNTSGEKIQIQETDGAMVNYYLSGDGTFKSVNKTANIGNNKCYLQLPRTFEAAATGETQTVKVGSIGKASFAAPVDLDFTKVEGLKAFTATGYDKSTKTIWLTRVMKVQKGEGVLLKGDPNSYEIPSAAVQSRYENMFVGNTSGDEIQVLETSEDGSQTNYYLKGDGSFVSVNGYVNIKNNKCYLALPTSMVAVSSTRSAEDDYKFEEPEVIKLPIDFKSIGSEGDGTTGVKEVKSGEVKGEEWYTLQGQRVAKPGKGLYIKNGKKVIVK